MSSWDRYERASQLGRGEDFGGPTESEGDRVKEGAQVLIQIRFNLQIHVNDEGRSDSREQTGQRASGVRDAKEIRGVYENQYDIEVCITHLGVVGVVFRCHLLVYCIELKARVFVLSGWENTLKSSWILRPLRGQSQKEC